jgi:hypothetical protein
MQAVFQSGFPNISVANGIQYIFGSPVPLDMVWLVRLGARFVLDHVSCLYFGRGACLAMVDGNKFANCLRALRR